MTDDDKALVERLREEADEWDEPKSHDEFDMRGLLHGAADEIERLREALGWFLNDSRFVVQVGGNPNVVPQMIEAARAALGETK